MKALLRSLALWSWLAGVSWLLVQPDSARNIGILWGVLRVFALAVAAVLTWAAASAIPVARGWRWLFWMVTLGGWLGVALLLQGRFENRLHEDDRQILLMGIVAAGLAAGWLMWREKRLPRWSLLGDMAAGAAGLALLGGAAWWKFSADTAAARERALARWEEIGMPLSDVEKLMKPQQETAGSQAVRQAFRDILSQRFYKEGTPAAAQEPVAPRSEEAWDLVNKATEVLAAGHQRSDSVNLPPAQVAKLQAHSGKLDAAYRSILSAESAVWACDPRDGLVIAVPNFLGLRMFSQLATAESLRLIAAGDKEGAERAISACKRMTEGLERNPTLVSLMIHVAVDALLAPQEARLNIEGSDRADIQRRALTWRQSFVRVLQWESWAVLHANEKVVAENSMDPQDFPFLPRWTRPIIAHLFLERSLCNSALNGAERAAIRLSPETAKLADFGAKLDDEISRKNPTNYDFSSTRAAMRMHATLLLREQAQIIREARARLASGQEVESRDSVVLPNVRWEVSLDAGKRSLTTRLANAPKWITDNVVTGASDFWLLPLDGSASWQFGAANPGTAAVN